jgi:YD repeat-containing protein
VRKFAIALTAFLTLSAAAQQHPNLVKGFDAKGVYQAGEYDSVNTWNGNLTISIPIGPPLALDGGRSFQFSLHSNAGVWDVEKYRGDCRESIDWNVAYAHRRANAGMGWTMTPGRLFDSSHNTAMGWVYESPDGADHRFNTENGVYTTHDSTYLRLTFEGTSALVSFPDGTMHEFEQDPEDPGAWRLVKILDNRGGQRLTLLSIVYQGRTWTVYNASGTPAVKVSTTLLDYETPPSTVPPTHSFIDSVTFLNSANDGASYKFHYAGLSFLRPFDLHTAKVQCFNRSVYAQFLESVELPDATSFQFAYIQGGGMMDSGLPVQMTLPTGGRIVWDWLPNLFQKPFYSGLGVGWAHNVVGVKKRTVYDRNATEGASWTYTVLYDHDANRQNPPDTNQYAKHQITIVEERTSSTDTTPKITENFYCVAPEPNYVQVPASTHPDYGRPFAALFPDPTGGGRSLSTVSITTSQQSGEPAEVRESTYVRYEQDAVTDPQANNPRVAARNVIRSDDANKNVLSESTDYRGYGRYRVQTVSGTAIPNTTRVTTTEYLDPQATGPWRTNLYSSVTTTDTYPTGTSTAKTLFTFNSATGFLEEKRTLRNGSTTAADDLQAKFTDDGRGNVKTEAYFGGDSARPDGATSGTCAAGGATPCFELHHEYDSGMLKKTTYGKWPFGGLKANYPIVNLGIHPYTRRVSSSTDPSNRVTSYAYDAVGRITEVRPPGSAWTLYTYASASATNPASVTAAQYKEREAAGAGNEITKSVYYYDGFGRLVLEARKMPGGWSKIWTAYDMIGRRTSEYSPSTYAATSDYEAFPASGKFRRWTYDDLGRVRSVTQPDNTTTTIIYAAGRSTIRSGSVATGATSNTTVAVRETVDGLGRLVSVVENDTAAGGSPKYSTTYDYGAGDRLIKVLLDGAQARTFDYDAAGLLRSETQPESGTTRYTYDPRGHVFTRTAAYDTPDEDVVSYRYDFAERISSVSNAAGLLKRFVYDSAVNSYGKMSLAERHNRLGGTLGDVVVQESFAYDNASGRLATKTTSVSTGETFTDSYAYDDLGAPSLVTYPKCEGCGGVTGPERSISTTRTNGLTTAVGNYTKSISYHANGLVHEIVRRNENNTDGPRYVQTSEDGMARPASITVQQYCGDLRSVAVASSPAITTNLTPATSVTLTASAVGPVSGWQWYKRTASGDELITGATSTTLTVTAQGSVSYFVRVSSDTCSVDSVAVSVSTCDALPAVIAPESATVSTPTNVSISVIEGATYAWSVSANAVISGSSTGPNMTFVPGCGGGSVTATVVVTTACGQRTASATIPVSAPTAVVSGSAVVTSSSETAPVQVAMTGVGPWQIQWSGQQAVTVTDAETTFNFGPGTYTLVSATDFNGCPASISGTAVVQLGPSSCALNASISSNHSQYRASEIATLTAATAGATYAWQISGNATVVGTTSDQRIQVRVGCSGTFTATVTVSQSGCPSATSSRTFSISQPFVEIRPADSGPFVFKEGGSPVSLKTYATSYEGSFKWSDGFITSITLRNGPNLFTRDVSPSLSTAYELISMKDKYGCTGIASGSAQVTYCPKPAIALSAPQTVRASETQTASVTAIAGASYVWQLTNATITSGAGTSAITFRPGCTGPISLSVTVTSSCGSTTTSTASIPVVPATAIVSGTTTIGQGSSATIELHLGGVGWWTVQWAGDAGPTSVTESPYRRIVNPVVTTSYSVVSATDGWGCSLSVSGAAAVTVKPSAPGNVTATGISATQIRVNWTNSDNVDAFVVHRDGVPLGEVGASVRQFVDTVAAGTTHLYHLSARKAQTYSDASARDIGTAMVFSTQIVEGGETVISAADIVELRTAVNALRARAGLSAVTWTDSDLTTQAPKAVHMNEMREALAAARVALQFPAVRYWRNPTSVGHESFALDVLEIRGGVE